MDNTNIVIQPTEIDLGTNKPAAYSSFAISADAKGNILPSSFASVGKFGGNRDDGPLEIASGTVTIDLGSARVVEKRYSRLLIASGATLAFSAAAASGTLFIARVLGEATIVGTINLDSLGGDGGAGGTEGGTSGGAGGGGGGSVTTSGGAGASSGNSGATQAGTDGSRTNWIASIPGGSGAGTTGTAFGAGAVSPLHLSNATQYARFLIIPGSGGGGGGGGQAAGAGGAGGKGGGAMFMEVGGRLVFSGTINARGAAGTNGATNGGGGGGGGGGAVVILANRVIQNSGTITATGGAAGTGAGAGGVGAAGFSLVATNTYFA